MQVRTMVSGKAALIASGKPFESVHDGDQNIFQAPVLKVVHDTQPEFGPLVGRNPQAQNLTFAFRGVTPRVYT